MTERSRGVGAAIAVAIAGVAGVFLLTAAVTVALSKLMIALASPEDPGDAIQNGAVAQSFMAANAAFSGLALVALLVTIVVQQRKMRQHRQDLSLQRQELSRAHRQLYRSAEADMRALHVELTKMAIDYPELAVAWPGCEQMEPERARLHLYSNLIFGHHLLAFELETFPRKELTNHLRILVSNEHFRAYWQASRANRERLDPDEAERTLASMIDRLIAQVGSGGQVEAD